MNGGLNAYENFSNGNYLMGTLDALGVLGSVSNLFRACFVAGTPLLTPDGSKAIEEFKVGDLVLSRDEDTPDGEVRAKRVLATFNTVSPVLNLHVGGRIIGTTTEHPFWAEGRGWTAAKDLRIGDVLVSHDGFRLPVEGVAESGRTEAVYNMTIEDDHTYFVGCEKWGWSVWAHNATCVPSPNGVILGVNRNPAWTATQLAEAGRKIAAINKAGSQGLLSVNRTIVRAGQQKAFRRAHTPGLGQQADHIVDLQLGGKDVPSNLSYLNGSVNASLGASIKAAIAHLQHGDKVFKVKLL